MKITKQDMDAFWEHMGPDWCCDDTDQIPEEDHGMAPWEVITLTCGVLDWQGEGKPQTVKGVISIRDVALLEDGGISLVAAIRRYLKMRTTAILGVEVPKDKLDELKRLVRALGGKVMG